MNTVISDLVDRRRKVIAEAVALVSIHPDLVPKLLPSYFISDEENKLWARAGVLFNPEQEMNQAIAAHSVAMARAQKDAEDADRYEVVASLLNQKEIQDYFEKNKSVGLVDAVQAEIAAQRDAEQKANLEKRKQIQDAYYERLNNELRKRQEFYAPRGRTQSEIGDGK